MTGSEQEAGSRWKGNDNTTFLDLGKCYTIS